MRLFVAIELSEDMKKSAVSMLHTMKQNGVKGNYTPIQNLHVTLCFIGEAQDKRPIADALSTVTYKPFKLSFTEIGNFGDLLWVGTRGGQGINTLAADIRKAFDNAGITYDAKKFVPHITLVRNAVGQTGKITVPDTNMMVKRVSLMKSERVNGKMVYTEVFGI